MSAPTPQQPSAFTSLGGQAVIEGVLMRSPNFVAVAVRKPDRKILIRDLDWVSYSKKYSFFKKPFLRGIATLVESLVLGFKALSFSADIAATTEQEAQKNTKTEGLSTAAIAISLITAMAFGLFLFVALPHLFTLGAVELGWINGDLKSPVFHLVDGMFKVGVLILYILGISQMKDIARVFQYHGAEHKSIYAFEMGDALTIENAKKYSTLHPRCGTSFLFFLVVVSILVFSVVFPQLGMLTNWQSTVTNNSALVKILTHLTAMTTKILLMLPVAGISYEFIRWSGKHCEKPWVKAIIWPGLLLQKLTTREPSDDQLEIALASLRHVLAKEKAAIEFKNAPSSNSLKEFQKLDEIPAVAATVAEFPS